MGWCTDFVRLPGPHVVDSRGRPTLLEPGVISDAGNRCIVTSDYIDNQIIPLLEAITIRLEVGRSRRPDPLVTLGRRQVVDLLQQWRLDRRGEDREFVKS